MAGRRTRFAARFSERRRPRRPSPLVARVGCLNAKTYNEAPAVTMSDPVGARRHLVTHETESP